jgi:putative ABC transport system permease protein
VQVKNYTITAGRMFTAGEDESRRGYAVLGSAIPEMFSANPVAMIGQMIQIRGIPFEIIGVLSEKGSGGGFGNPDEQILIPLSTARYRTMGTDRLRSITVDAANVNQMTLAMIEIERVLRREHKIRPGADNDFQIRNQADILSTFQQTTETFTYLLAGIAAVSLLVGGIGIMNIMLVSVTERTREIGVRKALGATRFNIMFQFLVEALVLCAVGGIIGILFGTMGAVVLSKLAHWNTAINVFAVLLAFVFSAIVGLFFGIWPARRAASLDPITALRYE